MTTTPRTVNVTTVLPNLVEVATNDPAGRFVSRTALGIAAFFPVGDFLEARVTPAQAEYFSQIENFSVEGYEPKAAYVAPVQDWLKEGERLYKQRQQPEAIADTRPGLLKEMVELFGKEAVMGMFAQGRANAVQTVETQLEDEAQATAAQAEALKAEREQAAGWTFFKLQGKVNSDLAAELLNEFDPAYNLTDKHLNAQISVIAKIANTNHVLSDRLAKL